MTSQVRSIWFPIAMVLITGMITAGGALAADLAEDAKMDAIVEESRPFLSGDLGLSRRYLFLESFAPSGRAKRRPRLDLSPLFVGVSQFLRERGIPLRTEHDREGKDAIGVSASFSVRGDLPLVRFEAGDPVDSFGAFYSKGLRCAFVWPAKFLTLRIEAGEDSDLGYFAIAGAQWAHATRPLALGLGIPMNLRDTEGDVGLILQFRMKLD